LQVIPIGFLKQTLTIFIVPVSLAVISIVLTLLKGSFELYGFLTPIIGGSIGLWIFWLQRCLVEKKKEETKYVSRELIKTLTFWIIIAVIFAVAAIAFI